MTGDRRIIRSLAIITAVLVVLGSNCQGFMPRVERNPKPAVKTGFSSRIISAGSEVKESSIRQTILQFSSNGHDDDGGKKLSREAIMARNNARCCCKAFLTQRSIQSFMFLMAECRDPHSGKWIEDFLGLQNLSQYHGTGAFDIDRFPSWELVLLEMMEQPKGA